MSCKNCRAVCFHYSSREALTSLQFGVFLFAFAYFLAFTPAPYLAGGVEKTVTTAVAASQTFLTAADAVNGQVVSLVATDLASAEAFGQGLAFVGNSIGELSAQFIIHPREFGSSLRSNMRTLAGDWSLAK
ncbi:hypothetical protein EPN90_01360 [Patescibacteria group bacterium]|nr:MAG: hypothetical protein EPN90_01360 [Patescibacteria group bacterium]